VAEPTDDWSANFDAAIPALVGLLQARSSMADAAWALSTLVSPSQSPSLATRNCAAIRQAGAIEPLAALLAADDTKAAAAAAAALRSVATHEHHAMDAVLAAVTVCTPTNLAAHPYLLSTLRDGAAQRMKHAEALTRGNRAAAREYACARCADCTTLDPTLLLRSAVAICRCDLLWGGAVQLCWCDVLLR
jgi:hypothetical protein